MSGLDDTLPASEAPLRGVPNDRLPAGATIGRYVVRGVLGSGGMGVVYAAFDPELDRKIAIKLVRSSSTDEQVRARVRREAQALARLSHPNVVAIYDVSEHQGSLAIAMALVDGGTLRAWQETRPTAMVIDAYLAAGRGLAAAHARGLVHRDFKPENVLVARDGGVQVTDFGLARLDHAPTERPSGETIASVEDQLTAFGAIMGTLGYMPLEQASGGEADARSDQFSWCVALWEAIYGRRPFPGTTLQEHVAALKTPPVAPARSEVAPHVHRALLRGLSADPAARWPSMEALLAAIAPPPSRRKGMLLAGALALAAAAASAVVVSRRANGPACATSAARLAAVWSEASRAALAKRFATSSRPDVAATLRVATHDLDAYAADWARQWDASCASGERATDPLLAAQRANCLERSLVELDGTVRSMLAVDPEPFSAAWPGTLFTLSPPLEACEDVARLRAMPPAPKAEHREAIAQAILELHRARDLARRAIDLGTDLGAALAVIDGLIERLDKLAAAPAGEAAFLHAFYAFHGNHRSLATSLPRALRLARAYRDDRVLALALDLEAAAAAARGDLATAARAGDEARAARQRGGLSSGESPEAAALAGRYPAALALYEELRRAPAPPWLDPPRVWVSGHLAAIHEHLGHLDLARAARRTELEGRIARFGEDHAVTLGARIAYATTLAQDDLEAARRELETAIAVADRIASPHADSLRLRWIALMYRLGREHDVEPAIAALAIRPDDRWVEVARMAALDGDRERYDWALARAPAGAARKDLAFDVGAILMRVSVEGELARSVFQGIEQLERDREGGIRTLDRALYRNIVMGHPLDALIPRVRVELAKAPRPQGSSDSGTPGVP